MGFMPAKDIPTPTGHLQTREQSALLTVMADFYHEQNGVIIRRFWWICPDGNCTTKALDKEIERLRNVLHTTFDAPAPKKRRKPISMHGLLR